MKVYIHIKSERNDCFQTVSLPFKFAKEGEPGYSNIHAIPNKVLFNSRWVKLRSFMAKKTPYHYVREFYIGPWKTKDQFRISIEY